MVLLGGHTGSLRHGGSPGSVVPAVYWACLGTYNTAGQKCTMNGLQNKMMFAKNPRTATSSIAVSMQFVEEVICRLNHMWLCRQHTSRVVKATVASYACALHRFLVHMRVRQGLSKVFQLGVLCTNHSMPSRNTFNRPWRTSRQTSKAGPSISRIRFCKLAGNKRA